MLFLARALSEGGANVSVGLPDSRENRSFCKDQLRRVSCFYFDGSTARSELLAKARLARGGYDVIHSFCVGLRFLFAPRCWPKRTRPKIVYDWDEFLSNHIKTPRLLRLKNRLVEEYSIQHGDAFTAASAYLHSYLVGRLGGRRSKDVLLLPNGFDAVIDRTIVQGSVSEQIRADGSFKRLIYVGAITKGYQIGELIDLAEVIRAKRAEWRIYVIGEGPDRQYFERIIHIKDLKNHIVFLGRVPVTEIAGCLKCGDLLLFPFAPNVQNEARCPLKLYQYVASGVPIVTNAVGEVGRALGSDALYYRHGSADDMFRVCREAIDAIWSHTCSEVDTASMTWDARVVAYRSWLEGLLVEN
jgi:glycosyltransferase involved in cell wall biosynthesis